jgi:hypothetical protein
MPVSDSENCVLELELFVHEVPDPKAHDAEALRQTIAESGVDHHEGIAVISRNFGQTRDLLSDIGRAEPGTPRDRNTE